MKWIVRSCVSLLTALFVLSTAGAAHARELCPPGPFAGLCSIKLQEGGGIIGVIVGTLFVIAIVTSLFFLIFGGFKYITAAGDQGKTAQARQTLIAAIVGLVIALTAFFIVNTVSYVFTGQSFINSLTIPML